MATKPILLAHIDRADDAQFRHSAMTTAMTDLVLVAALDSDPDQQVWLQIPVEQLSQLARLANRAMYCAGQAVSGYPKE